MGKKDHLTRQLSATPPGMATDNEVFARNEAWPAAPTGLKGHARPARTAGAGYEARLEPQAPAGAGAENRRSRAGPCLPESGGARPNRSAARAAPVPAPGPVAVGRRITPSGLLKNRRVPAPDGARGRPYRKNRLRGPLPAFGRLLGRPVRPSIPIRAYALPQPRFPTLIRWQIRALNAYP